MVMDGVTLLGLLAGTLTTVAFFPQLLKTWRTKSAADVSLGMLITFCIGVFLWLVYGFLLGALPIILANLVTLVVGACPTLPFLLRRRIYGHLRRCRPEKILNVFK
jgi:MtN3 and saliva related transmembrane protein